MLKNPRVSPIALRPRGFTLVEMMVAVAIFAIVMTVALGALLSMSESDRKAQTLKSVINNLNFALDSMSRSIRTGSVYHCDSSQGSLTAPRDCEATGASSLAYQPALGGTVIYRLETSSAVLCGQTGQIGCIVRSTDGGVTYGAITSSEVYINSLTFYVNGAESAFVQPKATILISGVVKVSGMQTSPFNLQTSVTQRLYDQ